jgi:hypothetical protein
MKKALRSEAPSSKNPFLIQDNFDVLDCLRSVDTQSFRIVQDIIDNIIRRFKAVFFNRIIGQIRIKRINV